MAAQQLYSKGSLFLKGVLIAEATRIMVRYSSGSNAVDTIEKGRAGRSPGAVTSTVQVTSAVPAAGVDIDYITALTSNELIDVVVFARGKKIKFSGFINDAEEEYGVNTQSFQATIECGPPEESVL